MVPIVDAGVTRIRLPSKEDTELLLFRRYYFFTISAYIWPVTQYQLWLKLAVAVVMTLIS